MVTINTLKDRLDQMPSHEVAAAVVVALAELGRRGLSAGEHLVDAMKEHLADHETADLHEGFACLEEHL